MLVSITIYEDTSVLHELSHISDNNLQVFKVLLSESGKKWKMTNRWGNNGNSDRLLFSWAPESLQMMTAAMKLKDTCSLGKKL